MGVLLCFALSTISLWHTNHWRRHGQPAACGERRQQGGPAAAARRGCRRLLALCGAFVQYRPQGGGRQGPARPDACCCSRPTWPCGAYLAARPNSLSNLLHFGFAARATQAFKTMGRQQGQTLRHNLKNPHHVGQEIAAGLSSASDVLSPDALPTPVAQPATRIFAPAECRQHLTAPEPIRRGGPPPPPENVNRLRVLTDPGAFHVLPFMSLHHCC